jgi:hypothetical protein
MSKKEVRAQEKNAGTVTSLVSNCVAETCKAKSTRLNFCDEHFQWFKEGLVTKTGVRPSDFDKKYVNYMKKKSA